MDYAFLEMVGFVDCKPDGNRFLVVVGYFVFDYCAARSASSMFGAGGVGKMPFYVGCS